MTGMRLRSLGSVLLAIVGVAVLGLTSMLTAVFVSGVQRFVADIALRADQGWIMGGTSVPDPTVGNYMNEVLGLYLQPASPLFPGQPTFPGYTFEGLTTPEQFCPIVCLPGQPALNFGDSVNAGVNILHEQVVPQLLAGDNVTVLGYSQSATIATQEMTNLINDPDGLSPEQLANLHFVLLGDPNNPIGGILDRFQFPGDQHLPFLNVPLSMDPTPTDVFPTDIYTGQYDGWANFPRDPLNLLAVLNALIGIQTVHPYYPDPAPGVNLDTEHIIDLGTLGSTNFYAIPAPLPVLAFMYDGGSFGRFFYDVFNPYLSLINNWGYGNPGDPFVGINGTDAIGPWQVNASGDLVASGTAGFFEKMDPLQMLAGIQYAGVQTLLGPLGGLGLIPDSITDTVLSLSGYDLVNQLDQVLLTGWGDLATMLNVADLLGPDAIFDGGPLIPGDPLIALVGVGFDVLNSLGV